MFTVTAVHMGQGVPSYSNSQQRIPRFLGASCSDSDSSLHVLLHPRLITVVLQAAACNNLCQESPAYFLGTVMSLVWQNTICTNMSVRRRS